MQTDQGTAGPMGAEELVRLRHEALRATAPAVQHEVNNALMVLNSNLELLGRSAAEGPPRRQLDRALEAVRRLDQTVRGYLDAARRPVEDPQPASPAAAVRQALPLLKVVLGARFGFDLDPAEKDALPEVPLDRGRLDLALVCLARQAAGRMEAGARIQARGEARAGEVALVLTLPAGAEPDGEAALLLAEAVAPGGGRLERTLAGVTLIWPIAPG